MNLKFLLAVTLAITGPAAMADTVKWYPNTAKTTVGSNNTQADNSLSNLSYWVSAEGTVGSGLAGENDDLVFDRRWGGSKPGRMRIGSSGRCTANSLQVGGDDFGATIVQDPGSFFQRTGNEGLKLVRGNWWFNGNSVNGMNVYGPFTVLAKDSGHPFVFHVGQVQFSNLTARLRGEFKGGDDAFALFGPYSVAVGDSTPICARNSRFHISDISKYSGTIEVKSAYENDGDDFGSELMLDPVTSGAKVIIGPGGSIATTTLSDEVTVGSLSFADGTRIRMNHSSAVINGKLSHFRATDSLTVNGTVEIYYRPIIRGAELYRIPVLTGPAGSSFTEENFKLTFADTLYNLDLHLEVEEDEAKNERTLYVVTSGFVYQTDSYAAESARDGTSTRPSSITNSAHWWGGLAPHPTNAAAIYRTATGLRTLYDINSDYSFPCSAFFLDGGSLVIQTKSFRVPVFYVNRSYAMVATGQGHGSGITSLVAPKIHMMGENTCLTVRTYAGGTIRLAGDISGGGKINLLGWENTGSPIAKFMLDGMNTNFTGSISVATGETRPEYHDLDSRFPTLYVNDGRNLGGRMAAFDPRALTLTTLALLSVTNRSTVTLADGLNRGVYIKGCGRFFVNDDATLDVKWPVLLGGRMRKEGGGTLVLGGGMKHELEDEGDLSDTPRAGSNLFEIVQGKVRITHADALAGTETSFAAGTSMELVFDPDNEDLMKYGIRNVTTDSPVVLDESFGGKLPLSLDASKMPPPPPGTVVTNGVLTVKKGLASAVRQTLDLNRPWKGISSRLVELEDDESGTVTFALESRFVGMVISVR